MGDELDKRREQSVYGREGLVPERLLHALARVPVVPESMIDKLSTLSLVQIARMLAIKRLRRWH